MTSFSARFFALSAVGITLLACGDDDTAAIPPSPPTDATQSQLAGLFCQKATECTSDLFIQIAYRDADGCKARVKSQLALDVKSNGYGVTDSSLQTCIAAAQSVACTDILAGKVPDSCKFVGSLADGTNCTADAQCRTGSCFLDDKAACGKCGPRAALGADCTNSQCDYGLKCNATKICTDGAVGAACTVDSDCRSLTYCRKGVCTAPLPEGAACVTRPGTTDPPCDLSKALFCFPNQLLDPNGTCKKVTVSVANNGEKCGLKSLAPPEVIVCTNGDCINDLCVAHLADGAACTDADGQPKCQEPAKCRAGFCSLKDSNTCK
jgi:hypothetical protein